MGADEPNNPAPVTESAQSSWSFSGAVAVLSTVIALIVAAGELTVGFSDPGRARVGALLTVCAGVLIGGREVVHLFDGYIGWQGTDEHPWAPTESRKLTALVLALLTLSVGAVTGGAIFFFLPSNVLELALFTAVLLGVVVGTAEMTALVGSPGGPRTGTAAVSTYWLTKKVRKIAKAFGELPLVEKVDDLLLGAAGKDRVSRLVLVACLCLFMACGAQALALSRPVIKYINQVGKGPGQESAGDSDSQRPDRELRYDELCGGPIKAGDGAPEPEAAGLRAAWAERGGVVASCAKKARPVPGTRSSYFAPGYCRGEYRAFAIASPSHPAAVALEQVARVGRAMIEEQKLIGASQRRALGDGDFQILFTHEGPYLAIRETKTDGNGGPRRKALRCEELLESKSRYVFLPPGMSEIWVELAGLGLQTWPSWDTSGYTDSPSFRFYDESGRSVGTGSCTTPVACRLSAGGIDLSSTGKGRDAVTATRIRAVGPSG